MDVLVYVNVVDELVVVVGIVVVFDEIGGVEMRLLKDIAYI